MNTSNYYEILGVDKDASHRQIKKAYGLQEKRYNLNEDKTAEIEESFNTIKKAYEILKDPIKRNEYDETHGYIDYEAEELEYDTYDEDTQDEISDKIIMISFSILKFILKVILIPFALVLFCITKLLNLIAFFIKLFLIPFLITMVIAAMFIGYRYFSTGPELSDLIGKIFIGAIILVLMVIVFTMPRLFNSLTDKIFDFILHG